MISWASGTETLGGRMATVDECRQALRGLAARMASDPDTSGRLSFDRTLSCHVRDLDVDFHGRLKDGAIVDLADGADGAAKIKLSAGSDDLVALVNGNLNFAGAWASGRISVKASVGDLLKLRKLR
jgi:predicted lipid carrier protein YhbT